MSSSTDNPVGWIAYSPSREFHSSRPYHTKAPATKQANLYNKRKVFGVEDWRAVPLCINEDRIHD